MSKLCPKPLVAGDLIGIAAPAGPFPLDRFQQGLARLSSFGFRIRIPDQIYDRNGFLAGSDEDRAGTFNDLLADSEVRMIIAARGGYGVMRILDLIDYSLLESDPKIIAGFSDLTALLLSITHQTGLTTFHAPVVTHLTNVEERWVKHFHDTIIGKKVFPLFLEGTETLVPGRAQGPLMGGNLTIIVHMLAAGRLPDLDGAILFIEDVDEAPYRIDRMLTTLKLAGILDRVGGIIIGEFTDCGPEDEVGRIWEDIFSDFKGPIVASFPIGHGKKNVTLPIGRTVLLDTWEGVLDLIKNTGVPLHNMYPV